MTAAEWQRAIITVVAVVGPLISAWWTKRHIAPVKTGVDTLVSQAQSGPQEGRITPPHPD